MNCQVKATFARRYTAAACFCCSTQLHKLCSISAAAEVSSNTEGVELESFKVTVVAPLNPSQNRAAQPLRLRSRTVACCKQCLSRREPRLRRIRSSIVTQRIAFKVTLTICKCRCCIIAASPFRASTYHEQLGTFHFGGSGKSISPRPPPVKRLARLKNEGTVQAATGLIGIRGRARTIQSLL